VAEARAIAESCKSLIAEGMDPRKLLILISYKKEQLPALSEAFQRAGVAFDLPRTESITNSDPGRFVLGLVRIVCDSDDYVAHRLILGLLPQVGVATCNRIANLVIELYQLSGYLPQATSDRSFSGSGVNHIPLTDVAQITSGKADTLTGGDRFTSC
jgi:hypothetical protein